MIPSTARDAEWNKLFSALSSRLAAFGNGKVLDDDADFFLIDDDWGGHHHKLEVIREDFWSTGVEEAIRSTLREHFPHWGVIVVFEGGVRPPLVVYADATETSARFE